MSRCFFGRRRAPVPIIPIAPATAAVQPMQFLNPYYLLTQISPVVQHGLRELPLTTPTHTITETCLISYLMGLGFDYNTALAIVESWETDQTLLRDGLLSEVPVSE